MERHGRRAALTAALCSLGLALGAAPALAATGFEEGDTGDLPTSDLPTPAQDVGPAAGLDVIDGTISGSGDRDVYKVCLADDKSFSASTVRATSWDTQLFLLDAEGKAVYSNDDTVGIRSVLPANHDLLPPVAGEYYLAIGAYNSEPAGIDGAGKTVPLFEGSSRGVNGPAHERALRPAMTGWSGTASSSGGHYEIDLTGARGCDQTAPTIDIEAPADGAEFELGEAVAAKYSCTDRSGVASCTGDAADGAPIDTSSLGTKTFTVVAIDRKGNRAEKRVTYEVVDRTKPTVDLRTPPKEGEEYALGDSVAADYSCADSGGSGLASCDGDVADGAPIDTASLGEHSFSVTATDRAGNETVVTHSYRVVDRTAPTVALRSPSEGAEFELGEVVDADYSCDDGGGSGVATCAGDVADGAPVDTSSLGEKTFNVVAVDRNDNRREVSVTYRVVDRTDPTVDLRSPSDDAEFELGQIVHADYSCADAGGSQLDSCAGDVADGAPVDTASLGEKSFTVTARDGSGNEASATHTYRVVDRAKPTIDLRTPAEGAVYEPGAEVMADYSCADAGGSGLESCTGDVAAGSPVDTAEPGLRSFTVTARDAAGNVATKTVSYSVAFRFDFEGFYGLADWPTLNRATAGSTVKIAFSLNGYQGREVFAPGYPRSIEIDCGTGAAIGPSSRAHSPGRVKLRYKPRRDLYVYLWKTDRDWRGECRKFVLKLDDGSFHRVNLRFLGKRR